MLFVMSIIIMLLNPPRPLKLTLWNYTELYAFIMQEQFHGVIKLQNYIESMYACIFTYIDLHIPDHCFDLTSFYK